MSRPGLFHEFLDLVRRFERDERGVFVIIFAILAIVLVAAAGAVVDFSSVEQARTRAQLALDSAALGLQPTIYTNGVTAATLKTQAQALVTERLADSTLTVTLDTPTINTTEGTLGLSAAITRPTAFMNLVGMPSLTARIQSIATRKRLNLEVAMVLDNSNSMNQSSRMTNLIAAAKCAENILFNGDCNSTATTATSTDVKIAIVPFTLAVNVGTGNASASWLDRSGANSALTRNNFDSDDNEATPFAGTIDRISTMASMTGMSWGGCVEGRIHDTASSPQRLYDTDDTLPSSAVPYSMFTPYFAPDEPDSGGYNNNYLNDRPASCTNKDRGSWSWTQNKYSCTQNANNYDSATCDQTRTTNSYSQLDQNGNAVSPAATTQPSQIGGNNPTCNTTYTTVSSSGSGSSRRFQIRRDITCNYSFTDREVQERLCKYNGNAPSGISQASVKGPNGDCPVNPILPLTSTKSAVTSAIDALAPQGGTNIHAGVEWGFRVLSPTAPFTEGLAYSNLTSKVMIVMTDGENTAYQQNNMNGATYYSYYGYPYNARLGDLSSTDAQLQAEMDARMLATCTNAKAAGIAIYTVGLAVSSTSNPTATTQLLEDCSSGAGYAYFPASSSDLISVFSSIADQLANLRLAK